MASLRDVFQHAGKPVQVLQGLTVRAEGKGMQRGTTLLLEAKLEPRVGETIVFPEAQMRFRVTKSEPQFAGEKIDHYRVEGEASSG
jgi:hypothetical protein